MNFEEAINRIGEIVNLLELGNVSLEQSLSLFDEGTSLIKKCGKMLDEAEQKVVLLKQGDNGEPEELPFDSES